MYILIIGLEPILYQLKSDFKSDVSTKFHQTSFYFKLDKAMAQFDIMISFSLIYNLLLVLYLYYTYNITKVIPNYVETRKFRNKILLELNNVRNIVNLSSYTSVLDFKYWKGFA